MMIEENQMRMGSIEGQFKRHLDIRGHKQGVRRSYLDAASHFLHWLEVEHGCPAGVLPGQVGAFLKFHLPHCICRQFKVRNFVTIRAALNRLLLMVGQPR